MAIGFGLGTGPARTSTRGVWVGRNLGPVTATATLTPRSRSRRSASSPRLLRLRKSAPPPTNVERALGVVRVIVGTAESVVLGSPLATKMGRTRASTKVDATLDRFFLHLKVLIGGVAAVAVLLVSLIVIVVS